MLWWKTESRRLKELEEQVAKLERAFDERDLDWVELRARCKRLLDRTEKAAKAVVDSAEPETTSQDGSASASAGTHPGSLFSDHQRTIQQQILRRRAGL